MPNPGRLPRSDKGEAALLSNQARFCPCNPGGNQVNKKIVRPWNTGVFLEFENRPVKAARPSFWKAVLALAASWWLVVPGTGGMCCRVGHPGTKLTRRSCCSQTTAPAQPDRQNRCACPRQCPCHGKPGCRCNKAPVQQPAILTQHASASEQLRLLAVWAAVDSWDLEEQLSWLDGATWDQEALGLACPDCAQLCRFLC